jgi:hypothetical protein
MERNATPGDGVQEANWHSATVHTGWDAEPKQETNWGTPGAPNSDIPLCATDDQCVGAFPDVGMSQCEHEICNLTYARCDIAPIADGEACDDGLFCTVSETCLSGTCGNALPMDCADESPCTLDECDESAKECTHAWDPLAIEGPGGNANCSDTVDNDCDGLTDIDDPQCKLLIDSVTPSVFPTTGGWDVEIVGGGFDIVTQVTFGTVPAVLFTAADSEHLTATVPMMDLAGDYDLSVTDGVVTYVAANAIRFIGLDAVTWGNTQWPIDLVSINLGDATPVIYGRVWADGVTNVDPVDGTKILAQIGYGPADSNPFTDPGWMWFPTEYNADCRTCTEDCKPCGENYEYMATVTPTEAGAYIVAFRYSIDGGFNWQFGDLTIEGVTDGSADGWDPATALQLSVAQL